MGCELFGAGRVALEAGGVNVSSWLLSVSQVPSGEHCGVPECVQTRRL